MFEKFTEEVSLDLPCGPFIDDDEGLEDDFVMLESIARINQESLTLEGDEEGVDWRDMLARCEDLAKQTKDVRVYIFLAQAALYLKRLTGLAGTVRLIKTTLIEYWAETHPILDDAKDETPWRIMTLNELSGDSLISLLTATPIVESKQAGSFTLRDIRLAKGEIQLVEGSEEIIPEMGLVEAAFQECDQETLSASLSLVNQIQDDLTQLQDQLVASECSHARYDWDKLISDLKYISGVYSQYVSIESDIAVEESEGESDNESGASDMEVIVKSTGINNRTDVLEALGKICEYYTKYEPSSPVPILVERTKKLVTMDFMSIMKELSPEGVKQVELIAGVDADS
ncbi:MAG: type VI secretion system protein ImpA [Oleispira sp.]|jgi:type VI secretion system protein ImpA